MSLKQWETNGWLRPHKTSRKEIENLVSIARRDISDSAAGGISSDWRFGIAYNAVLKLCTVLLYSEGYRPSQNLAHYRTLQALPLILGDERKTDAVYLDTCRAKRNTVEYDYVGGATEADADELIEFARGLEVDVLAWLDSKHPELKP
ncbi:MAG TPA: hypothetical protein PKE26_03315 [Kiritimatiellia bacterium]|nr:hypothetical protein [Kiritimatiellia bacterium]HMO98118.1 hypothetical protein [Kiritimatiellia bacterium]HMP96175.1 hypothetical protein [Kiritimatiellia bacterium]